MAIACPKGSDCIDPDPFLVVGGPADERFICNGGDDTVRGLGGDDTIQGSNGNDQLFGGRGDDRLNGGSGDDRLNGGQGDDKLSGGQGNDALAGGEGRDILFGGQGEDTLFGGTGADRFVFTARDDSQDRISDFEVGVDEIRLNGVDATDASDAGNGNTLVTLDNGASVLMIGVSVADAEDAFGL